MAFSDHPATVLEVISLQYFVDGLKDEQIQKAVRMADVQDLKSALLYALKLEAANEASCRDRHSIRGAKVAADAPFESKEVCRNRKGSAERNGDVPSRRPCPENSKYCSRVEKKFGVIDQVVRQVTTPSTSELDSVRKDQLDDPEIKPIIEFNESSDEKPAWQDIAPFHPTTKRYWALWDSLHLRNGVLYRKWESDGLKNIHVAINSPKDKSFNCP
ncbi:gag-pol [Trichonephila clavipes]|nr:gag-pol [Trichonephila clavipes]